jgi:hypothetical protein
MSTAFSSERNPGASPQAKARAAGACWLFVIVTGALAMVVGGKLAVAANLAATAFYVAATVLVYQLLKPVNAGLSLIAAISSFAGCAIGVLGSLFHVPVGRLAFVFFGLHCLLVGYLILRSTFLPRFVGALMALGGTCWLTLGLASLLSPTLVQLLSPYIMIPGIVGEASLSLWLLVQGVNVERWREQAGAAGEWRSQLATNA